MSSQQSDEAFGSNTKPAVKNSRQLGGKTVFERKFYRVFICWKNEKENLYIFSQSSLTKASIGKPQFLKVLTAVGNNQLI